MLRFAAWLAVGAALAAAPAPTSLVADENAREGSTGWIGAESDPAPIEGYASEASVLPGETVRFHVSVDPAGPYEIRVFRLGWYGGAGGRLVATLAGTAGPQPRTAGPDGAHWPVANELRVPADWVSGYYLARFQVPSGRATSTIFVVQAPASRRSRILVQVPVNTWQAYNPWGGKSLYDDSSPGGRASHVSFLRPYTQGYLQTLEWEIQLVRFLEREGYDVSYQTDVDTHRDPSSLLSHRLVIVAGHGEYWSSRMRDAFEAARDAGTNLAFMGANIGYWQIRYENSERTLVGYKSSLDPVTDPALRTVLFRELDRPECQLLGVMFQDGMRRSGEASRDFVVAAPAEDPWLAGTGLVPLTVLPGVVGPEWDTIPAVPPADCAKPGLTVLFRYAGPPMGGHAVRYTAPTGARVFSAGSLQFAWGLDGFPPRTRAVPNTPISGLQQFMRNALDDLTRPASPLTLRASATRSGVYLSLTRAPDPRVSATVISRDGVVLCRTAALQCLDEGLLGHRSYSYRAVDVDQWGESAPRLATVRLPNASPRATMRGPRVVRAGVGALYIASARDRDGDAFSYRWRLDGHLLRTRGERVTVRARPGRHVLLVVVSDGYGGKASAALSTRVLVP